MGGKSSTQTSTVQIPPEVMEQYRTVIGRANQITQKPFEVYSRDPSAFVAPLTSTQQAGIANINAMQGMAQPSIQQGQEMIMQGIGAAAPLQVGALNTAAQARDLSSQLYGESIGKTELGQQMGGQLFGQSLGTAAAGRAAGSDLYNTSLGTVGAGQGIGGQLYGQSLGTAAEGTGQAGDIFGKALPAIQQAVGTGAAYGQKAASNLSSALGAAAPLMAQGTGLTTAGLKAGANYGQLAANYLQGATGAVDPTAFSEQQIDKYMSPYMKNVVEAQQALQAEEAAAQRSALKGQAIAAGAFGGDRGGIAQANLARQQSLANQATLANLLQGGYGQALGAFQQQQATQLAAEQANRAAQQFGSQQAAALGQQLFGQNLAAGSQLSNIGQALFGQNITQGQALAALGQTLYGQGLGGAQAAANIGTNYAQIKAQEAALQQQAAQGVFGQAAQTAALQQQAAQGVFGQAAQEAALQQQAAQGVFGQAAQSAGLQQQAAQGIFGQAAQDAALQQAASQNLYNMGSQGGMNIANLGIAGQTAGLQGAQAQLSAGQIEQQTEQAAKSAIYNQFLQQQGFPYQQVGFLGNVSMGIGSQSGGTTTTTGGSYSDRRLKENIRKVGETFDGQPIYSFRYKGEEKTQLGLMAQEVEKMHPDAVGERKGYLTVDYHDATEDAARRGHFASGGLVPTSMGGAVTPLNYREGFSEGGDPDQSGGHWQGESWVPNEPAPAQAEQPAAPAAPSYDPRIAALYQKYLFRDPDPIGGEYWQKELERGASLAEIEAGFANSQERNLVNAAPLAYNPASTTSGTGSPTSFNAPVAPIKNRYGFYSAPNAVMGSPNAPAPMPPTYTPPTATGKGPSTGNNVASSFNQGRYGTPAPATNFYSAPTATGKGPSTNAYTGTNYSGMSGSYYPTATGKGPSTNKYANGGRIGYAAGGASELKDYIDMMSSSPKGLAMSHAGIFKMPGERADITKYSEGMLRGRSNIPQPVSQMRQQPNLLKEAADFGTSVSKIADFGEKAKTKLEEWTKPATSAQKGSVGSTQTPSVPTGGATPTAGSNVKAEMTSEQFGPPMPPTNVVDVQPDQMGEAVRNASSTGDTFAAASMPDYYPQFDEASGDLLSGIGSLFAANGGRINKFDGGPTWGTGPSKSDDPSEGAYDPIGPSIDMGEVKVPQASNVPKPGRGGGGGGSGGGGFMSTVGQAAGIASTAFSVGKALISFLPMVFSDERLKKHIKPIGRLYDGQTVYRFDMGGETKIGLLAQEVEKHVPDAVGLAGKYKSVDYEMATAKAAKRKHFYDGGPALSDISMDPVKGAIQMAALPSSTDLKLPDMSPSRDVVSDADPAPAPTKVTGLNPTASTGLSPEPDDRHAPVFQKMLGGEQRPRTGNISQIQPAAAKEAADYLGVEYDPERLMTDEKYNMQLGKAYFNIQLDNFGGDPMIAAAAYNAGPGRVKTALNAVQEKGGTIFDYLPTATTDYLAKLSDAAQGAHEGLVERKAKLDAEKAKGKEPVVIDVAKPDASAEPKTVVSEAKPSPAPGLGATVASAGNTVPPGLGAAMGQKSDWEFGGGQSLLDMVPKSADFWVPLIAAIGGMLGARAPNAANAIGAGLMAGASAYMKREEFQQEAMKNSLSLIKDRFVPNYESDKFPWFDKLMNRPLTSDQYSSIISQFPGMPRITPTMVGGLSSKGLGAAAGDAAQTEKEAPPSGGLAPAPAVVEPPKVTPPTPGATEAKPEPQKPAPVPTKTQQQKLPSKIVAENVGKIEIPDFGSQAEADAWVQQNMDSVFKGTPPLLDPRTYLQRAEAERTKEDTLEAEINKLTKIELTRGGDPRLTAALENKRKQYNDAQTQRTNAEEKARNLITGATAIAIERSKERVKVQTSLEKTKGERDITTATTLEKTQPTPGGPEVFQTQKQILDQLNKTGSLPSDNPGAGNPIPNAPPPVASQPKFFEKRMDLATENEAKMGKQFQERQLTKQRFDNLIKIVEAYQTGAFAEFKQDAVRWARGLGFDINDTDTANPAAFQKFRKNAINGIIEQAKGLAGPIAFKELDLIGKANVDAPMEPSAVASLLADGKGLLNYEDQYYKDYASWRKDNPNDPYPDFNFNVGWVEKNPTQRYITEARKDIAALGEKLPRDEAKLVHGQKYIIRNAEGGFTPRWWDATSKTLELKKPAPLGE